MAVEIERKFLLKDDSWKIDQDGKPLKAVIFRQGYIATSATSESTVRVRLEGTRGVLTIKGKTVGMSRLEFEYDIPLSDANEMLDQLCQKPLIEKTRHYRQEGELIWEIDIFEGDNLGLAVAEVELNSESQEVILSSWVGKEVTGETKYYNSNLVENPYSQW